MGRIVFTPWLNGAFEVTQEYGCTDYLPEGPDPRFPDCAAFHNGIDIGAECGHPITPPIKAMCVARGIYGGGPNALILRSGDWDIWLLHMSEAYKYPGDMCYPGETIARVGTEGFSTGCHLHFQVNPAGTSYRNSVDPEAWLTASVPLLATSADVACCLAYLEESRSMGLPVCFSTLNGWNHMFYPTQSDHIKWVAASGGAGGMVAPDDHAINLNAPITGVRTVGGFKDVGPNVGGSVLIERINLVVTDGFGRVYLTTLDPVTHDVILGWTIIKASESDPARVPTYEGEEIKL